MPTPHPHAALMLEYAKDSALDQCAWENWQIFVSNSEPQWRNLGRFPSWDGTAYRRKPSVIVINGVEVPLPIPYADLEEGKTYYIPNLLCLDFPIVYRHREWGHFEYKNAPFHLTEDAAITHAKALLSFTNPGILTSCPK